MPKTKGEWTKQWTSGSRARERDTSLFVSVVQNWAQLEKGRAVGAVAMIVSTREIFEGWRNSVTTSLYCAALT